MTKRDDDGDRLRALTELQSTLLVEAPAGTGKTSLLAGRVVMLLADGVSPASISCHHVYRACSRRIAPARCSIPEFVARGTGP